RMIHRKAPSYRWIKARMRADRGMVMDRPPITSVAMIVLVAATVAAHDHASREVPTNAIQPPGNSFEKHISRGQKILLVKDLIRPTALEPAPRPLRSAALGVHRLVERSGVRLAESIPTLPIPPAHQDSEAGGPCTPALLTPLFDSEPAYRALM